MKFVCQPVRPPDQISKPAEWHSASEMGVFLVSKGGFNTCFGLEILKCLGFVNIVRRFHAINILRISKR